MYRAGQEEIDEVAKVIMSKQWFRVGSASSGHLLEVERFEKEWAEKMGATYSLLMSGGGTASLVCALAAIGVGPGDEVIVPAYTWMATASSVLTAGAIPVLADIDETLAMDPQDFERKIGPHTKAVIPVHMTGRPANLEAIIAIARKHGIKVIEDSCQMDGGSYKGRRTGTWGDAGAFSFNQYKIISAGGEGGCLVTNDREIYERAVIYHDSGAAFRPKASEMQVPIFVAQQYRASEVMGAIARIQMGRMDGIIADLRTRRNALAAGVKGLGKAVVTPSNDQDGDCGVALGLQFKDAEKAKAFAYAPGVGGGVLIDSDKHVYTNWKPLREKRSFHHPDMNPFFFPKNVGLRADYSDSVCPRTLEILRRSVNIAVNPEWTDEELKSKIDVINATIQAL